jgi:aryl-alcohol dehydrogenase-like predicted oxidoreductase
MVSEIGFGCGGIKDGNVNVINTALKKGLNLLDTARGYGRGASEAAIGRAICRKHRDDVFIVTKGSAKGGDDMLRQAEASLKALQTDVIDVYLAHGPSSKKAVENRALRDAIKKLKKQGKIRFGGVSTHRNVVEALSAAAKVEEYDVLLGAYCVLNEEECEKLMDLVKKNDVGFLCMKSANARAWNSRHCERGKYKGRDLYAELKRKHKLGDMNVYQGCYRWALDHEQVHAVIPPMMTKVQLDQDLQVPFLKFE